MQATQTTNAQTTETIAITRTFDGIEQAARQTIDLLGGMPSILRGARLAIIKPNFVAGRGEETGSTTSFALIKAVVEEVRASGAEPVLCENPGTEFDREATYQLLGVERLCSELNLRILRLDEEGGHPEDWQELRPPGARRFRRFRVPRVLADACLINLPVLKTHVVSTMTLGMKNPMGLLPRPERRAMHTLGIDQSIVDLNLGLRPNLTIVDGSRGQDGEGPLYGTPTSLQVLVAGRSSLAVDLACCQLVGVNPRAVPHLRLALEQLGRPATRFVGTAPTLIQRFRLPRQKPLYRFIFWLMYPLDYPFSWLTRRGQHLCTALYSTGLVGTRPAIQASKCTRCGICVETCPLPKVINLETLKINYATCQRCLLCYEACPEGAISVRGYSGSRAAQPKEISR